MDCSSCCIHILLQSKLVFQIRVTSAPLNGFIFFSQVVAIEYNNNVSIRAMVAITETTYNTLAKILITGNSIWNLDFFPPCCSTILCE